MSICYHHPKSNTISFIHDTDTRRLERLHAFWLQLCLYSCKLMKVNLIFWFDDDDDDEERMIIVL